MDETRLVNGPSRNPDAYRLAWIGIQPDWFGDSEEAFRTGFDEGRIAGLLEAATYIESYGLPTESAIRQLRLRAGQA